MNWLDSFFPREISTGYFTPNKQHRIIYESVHGQHACMFIGSKVNLAVHAIQNQKRLKPIIHEEPLRQVVRIRDGRDSAQMFSRPPLGKCLSVYHNWVYVNIHTLYKVQEKLMSNSWIICIVLIIRWYN